MADRLGQRVGRGEPAADRATQPAILPALRSPARTLPPGPEGLQWQRRADDEEFSLPLLMSIRDERELVRRAAQWVYYYNVERPHSGVGMDGVSPWRKLRELGLQAPVEFALLPPVVCDRIAAHWLLGPGNDLLTYYKWFYKRPAMAVGLTDHRSPVGELTTFHMPLPSWSPPKRRGCPPRLTQLLVARWCT